MISKTKLRNAQIHMHAYKIYLRHTTYVKSDDIYKVLVQGSWEILQ